MILWWIQLVASPAIRNWSKLASVARGWIDENLPPSSRGHVLWPTSILGHIQMQGDEESPNIGELLTALQPYLEESEWLMFVETTSSYISRTVVKYWFATPKAFGCALSTDVIDFILQKVDETTETS